MDDRNDETNDERFALVCRKSGQTLEKSREESDETRNVRCAINASLPMFVANVDERKKVGAVENRQRTVQDLFRVKRVAFMQEFNQRGELTDLFTFRRVVSEFGEGDVSFLRRTVGGVRRRLRRRERTFEVRV